ncbi:L,D-transpeptidase [Oribacterium sp. WCC10]|uniref:L,D-transpeptidase n=1 Tax=Oribacterium sp. WCC10 TaxID=1855343 RepID=UPI0008ED1BDA|nr:L,D-transpeptidase [Oribacterium sp. WCC10]SFG15591.1 L,D-transpeptidase catalytic domain [Oribacterium sp. WCC10]
MRKSFVRSMFIALTMGAMISTTAYADIVEDEAAKAFRIQQEIAAINNSTPSNIDMTNINSQAASPAEAMATGQKLSTVNGMSVTYQMATGDTVVLDGLTISSWVIGNDGTNITVDSNQVAAYVQGLKDIYDTKGVQTWLSADGTQKTLATSYGFYIDLAGETAALMADIQSLQSVARPPVYSSVAAQGAMPQWGNTFVEVDISSQHAYFYQDGVCVWESPIVSGTATNAGRATPTGLFTVNYKTTDRILRGPIGKNGKPTYESHVDYWMPFNGGIGLHDANWRSSFGGDIYINNGSHGCINLPHDRAQALYGLINKGTVVVVCD